MSPFFYRKLTEIFGMLALGVLFSLIAFSAMLEIKDLDLWLHLKMGEIIMASGQVPAQDILSATIAGKPWVNHEWLFQVVLYAVHHAWGMDALLYLQAGVVLLTFLIVLLWTYRQDRQLVILPLLFIVLQIYQTRFTVRPDIFSLLYFISFLMILSTFIRRRWALPVLFVMQVVWTNMHGYFFWGPALVIVFLAAETLKRYVPLPFAWKDEARLPEDGYVRLWQALVLVFLATLINPLGFAGAAYPFKVLFSLSGDSSIFFKYITELKAPLKGAPFFDFSEQGPLKIMIFSSGISFLLNIRRIDLRWLLVWGVAMAFALGAMRNMVYFAFVAYIVAMMNLLRLDLRRLIPVHFAAEHFELLTGWMAKVACIVYLLNYSGDLAQRGYYDFYTYTRKSEFLGVTQRSFPSGLADFMAANKISGAVFNDFNSGAYLVGRLYPQVKVFIDGRTEMYGAKFFMFYRTIWEDGDARALDAVTARYNLRGAVLGSAFGHIPEKALKLFMGQREWKLVYLDHDGVVFLRDIPDNAALIARFAIDPAHWKSAPFDIRRMGAVRAYPYREANRAFTLNDMGYPDQAMAEADAALAISPICDDALHAKARIYLDRKDFAKAFEYYRYALLQSPAETKLRRGLALAYVGLEDYARALEQADRLDGVAGDPSGAYIRAKVFVKKKQYREAYDILAKRIAPLERGVSEITVIGDLYGEAGAHAWAVEAYALAIRKEAKNTRLLKKYRDAVMKRREGKGKDK